MLKGLWAKHSAWVLGGVCFLLQLLWFYVQLSVWKEEGHDHMLTVANIVVTCLLWGFLAGVIIHQKAKHKKGASKLTIHSATYGAIEGGGIDYPVEDFLNQIAGPNGLSFDIQSRKFKVNGKDYVSEDPKDYKKKRLRLTYSYEGGPQRTIRRREGRLLVLPEDPYIEGFPSLRLEVIDARNKLQTFFLAHWKKAQDARGDDPADRAFTDLLSGTPDEYLTADYAKSIKPDIVDLYLDLVIHGLGTERLNWLVHNANSRDAIEEMMGIFWEIAPKITEEDDEKNRVPGRPGSARKL